MSHLSIKQQQVLESIITFIDTHHYAPSSREIGAVLKHKSTSTTHGHFKRLREKGYLDWEDAKPRTLRVLKGA